MPTSTKPSRLLAVAVSIPLVLSACSHSGGGAGAHPVSPASASASTTAHPRSTTIPIATVYQVTARSGVTDKELQDAVDRIAKLPGVEAASVNRKLHQVRVDLSAINITKNAPAVYHALEKLGEVKAI